MVWVNSHTKFLFALEYLIAIDIISSTGAFRKFAYVTPLVAFDWDSRSIWNHLQDRAGSRTQSSILLACTLHLRLYSNQKFSAQNPSESFFFFHLVNFLFGGINK